MHVVSTKKSPATFSGTRSLGFAISHATRFSDLVWTSSRPDASRVESAGRRRRNSIVAHIKGDRFFLTGFDSPVSASVGAPETRFRNLVQESQAKKNGRPEFCSERRRLRWLARIGGRSATQAAPSVCRRESA